eukprot:745733-Hanusia_phi.AAC.1
MQIQLVHVLDMSDYQQSQTSSNSLYVIVSLLFSTGKTVEVASGLVVKEILIRIRRMQERRTDGKEGKNQRISRWVGGRIQWWGGGGLRRNYWRRGEAKVIRGDGRGGQQGR